MEGRRKVLQSWQTGGIVGELGGGEEMEAVMSHPIHQGWGLLRPVVLRLFSASVPTMNKFPGVLRLAINPHHLQFLTMGCRIDEKGSLLGVQ